MCGIAGIVSWDDRYRITRPLLMQMSSAVAHRGPDAQGLHLNYEGAIRPEKPQVGLVHRRLAVLDLEHRADQPFTDGTGRWIVFNGEIYNFRSLKADLVKLRGDYAWRTSGDTEVLLLAYDIWKERCVEYLNGMFAFAVWDQSRQTLFMARDRMGQKPLYWAQVRADAQSGDAEGEHSQQRPSAIAFASELSALRELPWVDRQMAPEAVTDYLCWGYIAAPRTIYRGVRKLQRAQTLEVSSSQMSWRRFLARGAYAATADPVEDTRTLVLSAVKRQLVSDVPVGCFLSGGVDSSIMAYAMKAAAGQGQKVLTFSIGFDDPRYDETEYAAAVAKHLGTEHRRFMVKPDAAADLPRLARAFGEPFGDSSALPTHYLSRETRKHVKVAISGDGGDELFGGYDRYRAMRLGRVLAYAPYPLKWMLATRLWGIVPGKNPRSRRFRFKRFMRSLDLPPAARYASYMALFEPKMLRELLAEPYRASLEASAQWLMERYVINRGDRDDVQASLAADRATYLPEDLFTKVDRCSMLYALEVRSPFMDPDLVDFAASLPARLLIGRAGKRMLRKAFAPHLPKAVFGRGKMGFAVPIGEWFRKPLREMLRDSLLSANALAAQLFNRAPLERMIEEHEVGYRDHTQRLYALLMLELWHTGQK